jgi:HEAT repeat protein
MYRFLVAAILVTGTVFLGLTVAIVLYKAWRESRRAWRRARRLVLEPVVLAYAHGEHVSLLPALGGRVRRGERRALEEVLLDHMQRVRGVERERLARALDELGYVDEYTAGLRRRSWWRRAEAAEKLGIAHAERAADALTDALHDDVHEVRLRAAKALGGLQGVGAVRPLIEALGEPNRWSTIRVANILSSMGPTVADEIIAAFPDLNLAAKIAAIDILGNSRALQVADWLRARLHDIEPDVRARACVALGAIDGPEAGPALVRAVSDPEWSVRALAAGALARIRHEPAVPVLCNALRDREWWVRTNAARALRSMGPCGIDALERMLDDHDGFARDQAALMLQEAGVFDQAVHGIASPDVERRRVARKFIARFMRVGQHSRLRDHAARHPDPRVRESLAAVLTHGGAQLETLTP